MSEFLNTYIADNDFFGIVLSIVMFRIGMMVSKKTKIAFFNPLLLAIIFCIAFLKITGISYDNFNKGGKYISFMIAPITVALVVSLYRNIDRLKANLVPILIMEVKVCCYAFRIDFFRRMLHGTKVKNLQIFRDDHNAARMLPRCSARADAAHCKTVFFRFGKVQPVFLAIVQIGRAHV